MLTDNELYLSDDQTIAGGTTTPSTNVIDSGVPGDARGNELFLRVVATQGFTGTLTGGTLSVSVRSADALDGDGKLASPVTDVTFRAVALADVVPGAVVVAGRMPYGLKRYIDVAYAVSGGTVSAGAKVKAFFSKEK